MWEFDAKFVDDDPNQAIQIKGFDLDFDTLTDSVRSGNMGRWFRI